MSAAPTGRPYDVVTLFECLHDMAYPVAALRTVREALAPGGTVIVMDEHTAEEWTAPGGETERFFAVGERDLVPAAGTSPS